MLYQVVIGPDVHSVEQGAVHVGQSPHRSIPAAQLEAGNARRPASEHRTSTSWAPASALSGSRTSRWNSSSPATISPSTWSRPSYRARRPQVADRQERAARRRRPSRSAPRTTCAARRPIPRPPGNPQTAKGCPEPQGSPTARGAHEASAAAGGGARGASDEPVTGLAQASSGTRSRTEAEVRSPRRALSRARIPATSSSGLTMPLTLPSGRRGRQSDWPPCAAIACWYHRALALGVRSRVS